MFGTHFAHTVKSRASESELITLVAAVRHLKVVAVLERLSKCCRKVFLQRCTSDVPPNTSVNLTDDNLMVFILPRSHARVIIVRRHGPVKSVYPLYLH